MSKKVTSAITDISLNRATFSDVSVNELSYINFFYGNNGSGKSSIAHAIDEDDGVVWADEHIGTVLIRTSDELKASQQKEVEANVLTELIRIDQ